MAVLFLAGLITYYWAETRGNPAFAAFHVDQTPFFFSSRRRHTSWPRDWSSDVCSSDLERQRVGGGLRPRSRLGQRLRLRARCADRSRAGQGHEVVPGRPDAAGPRARRQRPVGRGAGLERRAAPPAPVAPAPRPPEGPGRALYLAGGNEQQACRATAPG